MRVPAEVLLRYTNESDRFAEAHGTRPVNGSARLESDLPEGFPTPRPPEASPGHNRYATLSQRDEKKDAPERRQGERRQKNMPVTLDTRMTRSRRQSASPINVEI